MLFLLRALSAWPLWVLHALGAALGWIGWAGSRRYRTRIREHAALAGVDARTQRAAIVQAGCMAAEMPWLWLRESVSDADWVRWADPAPLDAVVAQGKPLLVLTPHLGCFEMAGRAFAERYGARMPFTVLYRPAKQDWLRELEATARARPHMATAPANLAGVRQMLRALRRGEAVGLLPDQVPPEGQGTWAPFFGRPAYTMTLVGRLARQTGARIVVIWCERLLWGKGFVIHGAPEVPPPSLAADADEDTIQQAYAAAVNRAMEGVILQRPAQYLWSYNRYKGPPVVDAAQVHR
jgi:Kdo2-lipid IVA lauroyltransferase/acyltransferase